MMTFPLSNISRWICEWFKKADKNNDGRMNFPEIRVLLKMMNVDMNEHHAHRLFMVKALRSS
jgi:phosphatidylinositol phospholipase C delta